MSVLQVTVRQAAADAIRRGHPWVWRSALVPRPRETRPAAGAEVQLVDERGAAIGRGLYDPESPIAARVWNLIDSKGRDGREPIFDALVTARLARALVLRDAWGFEPATTAYRLVHGEGDRMPGLVVDRYANVAVMRLDGAAAEAHADDFARLLRAPLEAIGIVSLMEKSAREKRLTARFGPEPTSTIEVREHGVPFVVDLQHGQKTGAFLDQRESRRTVGRIARLTRAERVLNLFSYAGGFSLHAALAGAKTTSVDIATQAHATAQASFRAAGLDPKGHEFVAADAFAFLAEAKKRGQTWDLIVSDPPSFAPNEKSVPRALSAYRSLHRACAEVLASSGVFCAASCSSHIDAAAFASTLDDAALGRSDLRLVEMHGPPADHPTVPGWPEGRYLKFAVLA